MNGLSKMSQTGEVPDGPLLLSIQAVGMTEPGRIAVRLLLENRSAEADIRWIGLARQLGALHSVV